ncbi:MAG: protein translocase subunit SecD, partial [Chitinophagales bacterium]|nr:protein translocase subunit SecD [Chitinophagales bacterium]
MQGKGFIKVIALLLLAICSYQLLFTWKANQIESQAIALAEERIPSENPETLYPNDLVQQFLYKDSIHKARIEYKNRYLDSLATEKVFLGSTFKKVKESQLNLGLDLQGGMSAVLQVNIKELLQSLSDNNTNPVFNKALDLAETRMSESADDYITLFTKALKETSPNAKLADFFATRANSDVIKANTSDDAVLKYIREEADNAIHRTYNIISTRIDQFGLRQPIITLEPRKGRITVEIGGVDNPARVRSMLQATASLEFWETYKATEIGGSINQANDALKLYLQAQRGIAPQEEAPKAIGTDGIDDILGDNNTQTQASNIDDILGEPKKTDSSSKSDKDLLKDIADKATDSIASQEKFMQEAPLFAVLNPAIDQNNMYLASPVIGYSLNIDTAKVNTYLSIPEVRNKFPRDIDFMWGAKAVGDKGNIFELYAIKKRPNTNKPFIDGSAVTNSKADIDQFGRTYIGMEMNGEGARKWKKMTGDNVGKNIAIVVDRVVYSAPNVENEISGGNSSITGSFTKEEATDLSNILKIGKLPASANIVEEETVGATLGTEAIRAGLLSMLAGFIMVIALMIGFYSTGGIFASVVLVMNLFLIVGVMAVFGSTLTLPGIAGIVLTMGMAVDANVLIFERVKEELRNGQTAINAVANGFKHSMAA